MIFFVFLTLPHDGIFKKNTHVSIKTLLGEHKTNASSKLYISQKRKEI